MWYNADMEAVILQFFESIRCDALTWVFSFFSAFGEAVVMAAAVILVYWLTDSRTGEQIAFTALCSLPVNVVLKYSVLRTRPYAAGVVERQDSRIFSTKDLGDNLSFPSGHAQCTGSFGTALALRAKKIWVWVCTALFVLLVLCSRLYFGVHYPTDLLAGLLLGVCVALFWEIIFRFCPNARYYILCGLALLALIPLLFPSFMQSDYVQAAGFLSGAAVFVSVSSLFVRCGPSSFPRRLWRIPVGLVCAGGVFTLTLLFPKGLGFSLLKWFLFAGGATLLPTIFFKLFRI